MHEAGSVVDSLVREQAVAEAIGRVRRLAMLSDVAIKIARIAEAPESTAQDMHRAISQDAALCTRVLRVVNSAFYGLPGQVGSVERAIVLLGLASIKNIAIAASLTRLFQGHPSSGGVSPANLWSHSIAVGTATRAIAVKVKPELAEEGFLAGLLHDIGILVELQYDRNKLAMVVAQIEARDCVGFLAAEEDVFGASHQDFGAALVKGWNLPSAFALVTGWHHRPLELPANQRLLPTMVYIADRLVLRCDATFTLDVASPDISPDVLDAVGLTREDVDTLEVGLQDCLEEARSLLAVP